jgi:hypothetical protein
MKPALIAITVTVAALACAGQAAGVASAATASAATASAATVSAATASAVKFANCAALNRKYPHGVGQTTARDHVARPSDRPVTSFYRNNALYAANRSLDRDHDGIACEKR